MENIITTLALIITSVATIVYATLTYFSLRETRIEKKKPIIEEILGVVLYPLKYFLDEELKDFKKGNARLTFIKGKFKMNTKIHDMFSWGANNLIYENFKKSHLNIIAQFEKHDEIVNELITKADNIAKVAYTPKFRMKCKNLIQEWDETAKKQRKISPFYQGRDASEDFFAYVVNNIKDLYEGHIVREFWKEKHNIFFNEIETVSKQQCKDLENTLKRLYDFTYNLSRENNNLIENYQKRYRISPKYITDKYEIFKFEYSY